MFQALLGFIFICMCMFYYLLLEDQETEAQKVKSYMEKSGFKLVSLTRKPMLHVAR